MLLPLFVRLPVRPFGQSLLPPGNLPMLDSPGKFSSRRSVRKQQLVAFTLAALTTARLSLGARVFGSGSQWEKLPPAIETPGSNRAIVSTVQWEVLRSSSSLMNAKSAQ